MSAPTRNAHGFVAVSLVAGQSLMGMLRAIPSISAVGSFEHAHEGDEHADR
ncbi:hypothetical protein [Rhodoblastus sp.]|uniref:hypothetical protein n=1 Tax=Rhodoblastus sp. TaxID=1962975 RepID=UPI00260196BF|nr:hypothetical protein [Rhodoblastus sp.]